jgi:hypothetical protein
MVAFSYFMHPITNTGGFLTRPLFYSDILAFPVISAQAGILFD